MSTRQPSLQDIGAADQVVNQVDEGGPTMHRLRFPSRTVCGVSGEFTPRAEAEDGDEIDLSDASYCAECFREVWR